MRRTVLVVMLAALVGALVAVPIAVYASHQFTDVPNTNPFHADIDWLADAGVTKGCSTTAYCPSDNVSREQMAAFMHRLAENQVVDAGTLGGLDGDDFVKSIDVLHASVTTGGALYGVGNAVSANKTATGEYNVTFGRSTASCSANATGGISSQAGGPIPLFRATFAVLLGGSDNPDPNTAKVIIWDPAFNSAIDSSFHLTLICS